ncbi:MAG: DUF485 domain-containing protein [Beijerinckiaceae bacterium]|jgi:uncharacterized membrane protein (DUF485 family)
MGKAIELSVCLTGSTAIHSNSGDASYPRLSRLAPIPWYFLQNLVSHGFALITRSCERDVCKHIEKGKPAYAGMKCAGKIGVEEGQVTADIENKIVVNPKFQRLVRTRQAYAWSMSAIMLIIYFGYILVVAYDKPLLAQKIGGGTTSFGILVGLGVILSAIVLTAIYVAIANSKFDALAADLKQDLI